MRHHYDMNINYDWIAVCSRLKFLKIFNKFISTCSNEQAPDTITSYVTNRNQANEILRKKCASLYGIFLVSSIWRNYWLHNVLRRSYLKIPFVSTELFIGNLQPLAYIITEYRKWLLNYLRKLIINSPASSFRVTS